MSIPRVHALVIAPHNAFAANGMGVLLAEKGHYLQARETFVQVRRAAAIGATPLDGGSRGRRTRALSTQPPRQVRDNVPDSLDVWVNLAHANLELGVFASAIKLVRGKASYNCAAAVTALTRLAALFVDVRGHSTKAR